MAALFSLLASLARSSGSALGIHPASKKNLSPGLTPLAQVRIDLGQRVIFSPAGKHVMAFGIASSPTPGGSSAITFHCQDSRTKSVPLRVEAAVDAMGGKPESGAFQIRFVIGCDNVTSLYLAGIAKFLLVVFTNCPACIQLIPVKMHALVVADGPLMLEMKEDSNGQ